MPDIPKDPRQLARDILAGKISLEDLAREQARRRGNVQPAPPPMARPPMARPPVARPPAARPAPGQPASESNMPAPLPMQKRQPIPPTQPRPQQRRPAAQQPARRPPITPARGPNIVVNTPAPPVAAPAPAPAVAASGAKTSAPAQRAAQASFLLSLKNRNTLRQGILIAEIFSKPVSLRDD